MSTIKVNNLESSTGGGVAAKLTSVNGGSIGTKNLIINGAMLVAQRGTSDTGTGYLSLDRFSVGISGNDESPTQSQVDVASGTTPYTLGFRKALKMTNGNQTSGAGTSDIVSVNYRLEAQDLANSGWNYISSSSYITLSFWCKSSVAQNFFGHIKTTDGTAYNYPFETGSLSADTWTKVTKTIPGNSNLQFDNNANEGLKIAWFQFAGTDRTASSATLNQWAAYDAAARTPDQTSTWYTTNDATFEITGVQLEVGSLATNFEHRSFAVEKKRCQRYYEQYDHNDTYWLCSGVYNASTEAIFPFDYQTEKRDAPTITMPPGSNIILMRPNTSNAAGGTMSALNIKTRKCAFKSTSNPSSSSGGYATTISLYNSGSGSTVLSIDAEL